ncbi:terminase small subunit [Chloroflexota bacterium]
MERKGNWIKGKSPYPKGGRPRGQNTLEAYYRDPRLFESRHIRWSSFALEYIVTVGNGAEAARRVGYSPKSARFIASRLIRNPVVRAMMRDLCERYNLGYWGQ